VSGKRIHRQVDKEKKHTTNKTGSNSKHNKSLNRENARP
jgi:hypothetical protein